MTGTPRSAARYGCCDRVMMSLIEIDPAAVDPAEVEMLQDLVMAAVNDAIARSKELERQRMASVAGGMGLPGLPGLP